MTAQEPIIRAAGEGEPRAFLGGGHHLWKLTTDDTGGAFFLFEDTMGEGKTTPLHVHPEADETVYVIEGELIVHVAGKETRVGAGGITYTPRGTPHAFLVVSGSARILTWQTPGIGQEFYRGASDATEADTSDAVDLDRLRASAQANPRGIELLGPPPFAASPVG
jgi:quercetin dioxygenase-like cupin family protein